MTAHLTTPRPIALSYLAPAVRLELLNGPLISGRESGQLLDASLAADIRKVVVTLEHSGCSQYSITLSNWRTNPKPGRKPDAGQGSPAFDWPRFKYNNFASDSATFKFGRRLRISMRYWPDEQRSNSKMVQRSHAWVPMISGPITDMKFTFGEQSDLTIIGEDDLSRLKNKAEKRTEFTKPALSELQIIREVLRLADFPFKSPAAPRVAFPPFASHAGQGIAEGLQDGQSYYDYLTKLAERMDCELFMSFVDPSPKLDLDAKANPYVSHAPPDGKENPYVAYAEQVLHFEPARSRARFDHKEGETIPLHTGQTILDFNPTLKVADQYTSVEVRGRHRDRGRPERISKKNEPIAALLKDELQFDDRFAEPIAGPLVRERFFVGEKNPFVAPNQPNIDEDRAQFMANAKLRKNAREFLSIKANTVGLPRLRPGSYVELHGLRAPFEGLYYVTQAVHTFDDKGLRTAISARRPGMPLPAKGDDK